MHNNADRITLQQIARRAMIARGLEPDFPASVLTDLSHINSPANFKTGQAKDMRDKLWCSIDNTESLDLDQLSCAEQLQGNQFLIRRNN
jgi:ribonuclease R